MALLHQARRRAVKRREAAIHPENLARRQDVIQSHSGAADLDVPVA
jgi:hypothetical protein